MKISDNALNVLASKSYKGIGRAWVVKNLKGGEAAGRVVALINESSKESSAVTISDFESVREKIRASVGNLAGTTDGAVGIGDKEFPEFRGSVKNSEQPVVLFYRGDLDLLERQKRNVAVIGLLVPDEETEIAEREVVSELVRHGVTIISGLALGCDTIAHKQALSAAGKTVAILPSPLNEILPSANRALAEQIVRKDGLLISEYYDSAKSKMELSGRYQERDRLQALFSDCVILAASYAKNDLGLDSGSRLAMEYAASYEILRAVMYDAERNAGNPKYDLNRQCIREQVGLVVITRANLTRVLPEILRNRQSLQPRGQVGQADMFG